jgi:hypothetical protein
VVHVTIGDDFSGANDGTAHFSGMEGVGDGIRNITDYALQRLGR